MIVLTDARLADVSTVSQAEILVAAGASVIDFSRGCSIHAAREGEEQQECPAECPLRLLRSWRTLLLKQRAPQPVKVSGKAKVPRGSGRGSGRVRCSGRGGRKGSK